MDGTVAWIHVAPIKALAVQERTRVELGANGIAGDRRFCIIDDDGRMLNAKRVNAFVAVRPEFDDTMRHLALRLPDGRCAAGDVALGDPVTVSIYKRLEPARVVEGPFAEALSGLAGQRVRLVRFDHEGGGVDRADLGGAATLLAAASLDALAEAASADGPVDPRRFRMLFGIAGVPAHAEDEWVGREVRVGEATLVPGGNVGRCAVTSVDPTSGTSDLDTLGALARYRGAVHTTERLPFGVWAHVKTPGTVRVGDRVRV
ncbi:MAG TPA: MOSC N-terminal beta barrel domain-containing protein [Candidatus Limnocylindria bacterium]